MPAFEPHVSQYSTTSFLQGRMKEDLPGERGADRERRRIGRDMAEDEGKELDGVRVCRRQERCRRQGWRSSPAACFRLIPAGSQSEAAAK